MRRRVVAGQNLFFLFSMRLVLVKLRESFKRKSYLCRHDRSNWKGNKIRKHFNLEDLFFLLADSQHRVDLKWACSRIYREACAWKITKCITIKNSVFQIIQSFPLNMAHENISLKKLIKEDSVWRELTATLICDISLKKYSMRNIHADTLTFPMSL